MKCKVEVDIPDGKYCYCTGKNFICCWYLRGKSPEELGFAGEDQCSLIHGVIESIVHLEKGSNQTVEVTKDGGHIKNHYRLLKNPRCPSKVNPRYDSGLDIL